MVDETVQGASSLFFKLQVLAVVVVLVVVLVLVSQDTIPLVKSRGRDYCCVRTKRTTRAVRFGAVRCKAMLRSYTPNDQK